MMNLTGIPVSRWIDGVLEDQENLDQPDNTRAMVLWGHAPNSQTRQKEMKTAMEKLDMLVVVDPYPTVSAVSAGPRRMAFTCCQPVRSLKHVVLSRHQTVSTVA